MEKEDYNPIKVAVRLKVSGHESVSGFQNVTLKKKRRETGLQQKSD